MRGRWAIAILALGTVGCQSWPYLQTPNGFRVSPPAIARVHDVHGISAAADGTLLELHYKRGQRFNLLLGGTSAKLSPRSTSSGIELAEGYAYVNGKFSTPTTATTRLAWPIIVTDVTGVGADGTEFIVQANLGPSLQRVFFVSGVAVHVWPLTDPTSITDLKSEGYVDITIDSGGVVTDVSAPKPIPTVVVTTGDMSDPRWFFDMVKEKAALFEADVDPVPTM